MENVVHQLRTAAFNTIEAVSADGRVTHMQGDPEHPTTHGALCTKVSRYAERVHHPDRLLHPLRRVGPKGAGRFERIGWDDALDLVAAAFMSAPGGILMAKIIMPDPKDEELVEPDEIKIPDEEERPANVIMAAAQGAQGVQKPAVLINKPLIRQVA